MDSGESVSVSEKAVAAASSKPDQLGKLLRRPIELLSSATHQAGRPFRESLVRHIVQMRSHYSPALTVEAPTNLSSEQIGAQLSQLRDQMNLLLYDMPQSKIPEEDKRLYKDLLVTNRNLLMAGLADPLHGGLAVWCLNNLGTKFPDDHKWTVHQKLLRTLVGKNIHHIQTLAVNRDSEDTGDNCLSSMLALLEGGRNEVRLGTRAIIQTITERVALNSGGTDDHNRNLAIYRGHTTFLLSSLPYKIGLPIINQLIASPDSNVRLIGELSMLRAFEQPNGQAWRQHVLGYLSKLGIRKDVFSSWGENKNFGDLLKHEISAIRFLEEIKPGLCKSLFSNFGIQHFARYPSRILVKQYEDLNKEPSAYGIVVYPLSDHNGAFYENHQILELLYTDLLSQGHDIKIAECEGRLSFAKRLIDFDQRYGRQSKASFAIVGGHGMEDRVIFGGKSTKDQGYTGQHLASEDLKEAKPTDPLVARLLAVFKQGAPVVLVSCSTGVPDGIAQVVHSLASVVGLRFRAPKVATNLRSLEPVFENGKLTDLKVEYAEEGVVASFDNNIDSSTKI